MCTEMHQSGIGVREKGKGYGQKKRNAYKVDNQELLKKVIIQR